VIKERSPEVTAKKRSLGVTAIEESSLAITSQEESPGTNAAEESHTYIYIK
jgi:hypothetical protein